MLLFLSRRKNPPAPSDAERAGRCRHLFFLAEGLILRHGINPSERQKSPKVPKCCGGLLDLDQYLILHPLLLSHSLTMQLEKTKD